MERPSQSDETYEKVNFELGLLMNCPYLKEVMGNRKTKWVSHPSVVRALDVVFFKKGGGSKSEIRPAPAFGLQNCVGIKIAVGNDESSVREAFDEIDNDPQLRRMKEMYRSITSDNDDIVGVVTPDDLLKWSSYYRQIFESGLAGKVSQKLILGLSGLERASGAYQRRLVQGLESILSANDQLFKDRGVVLSTGFGGLDYAFLDEEKNLKGCSLYQVRNASLEGQILRKTIPHEPKMVAGMIVRTLGENERETWTRARVVEEELKEKYPDSCFSVAVISGGQVSLFEKWGFKPLTPSLQGCQISLKDVMDFLYLGNGNDDPGILASGEECLSLPRNFSSYGVDVLFEKRNERGDKVLAPVDNVIGVNARPVDNVAGIVCVPDGYGKNEIDARLKEIKGMLNRINIGPNVNLVALNSALFAEWCEAGTMTYSETDKPVDRKAKQAFYLDGFSKRRRNKYESLTELRLFPLGPVIGSARMILTVKREKEISNLVIDWGSMYAHISSADRRIIGRATAPALRKMFRNGELPMVPSLYFGPYLLMTAKNWPGIDDGRSNDVAASYLRAEIAKRVSFADAVDVLGSSRAEKIYTLGAKDIKRWYGGNEIRNEKILFSHSHKDHTGMAPFLDGSSVSSWITSALLLASSNHSSNWFDNFAYQSRIDLKKHGGSYEKVVRKMENVFYNNQEVLMGNGLKAKSYFTNHSGLGSVAWGLSIDQANMLYSGDIKLGPLTDAALESIAKDDYNVFLWESTNPKLSFKPSVLIKEKTVMESFEKVFRQYPDKLIVIAIPPNYVERLESVINAVDASGTGRDVYVGLKHADILNHLRKALTIAPLDATGRDLILPEPGENIGIYAKPVVVLRPWQRTTLDLARGKRIGVIEQKDLRSIRGDSILVLSPFEYPEICFGGAGIPSKIVYIFSSPYPYEAESKRRIARIKNEIESGGSTFLADFKVLGDGGKVVPITGSNFGFHASGHADFEENMHMLERVLGNTSTKKTVYFTHGEKPQVYVRDAVDWFGQKGIKNVAFVGTFNHYNPKDPFNSPGHIIKFQK